jgi:ERCC4-type nuclease
LSCTVDPRIGSGDLVEPLQKYGVPAKLEHLEFADVEIIGRGPEERPVPIGVEIKAVGDLLRCITDERFVGHQLPGLLQRYEIVYLLIEGALHTFNKDLVYLKHGRWANPPWGRKAWSYEGVWHWLMSQENCTRKEGLGELRLIQTADRLGTAAWISALYAWWNSKSFEEHRGHLGLHKKSLQRIGSEDDPVGAFVATRKMKVCAQITNGIGFEKAYAVSKHFPSIKRMINAPVEEWEKIEGIGPVLAARLVAAIEKEEW